MVEANARAAILNDIVDGLEGGDDGAGGAGGGGVSEEDVVRELVSSFLLPEVSRAGLRAQVRLNAQARAFHAALMPYGRKRIDLTRRTDLTSRGWLAQAARA